MNHERLLSVLYGFLNLLSACKMIHSTEISARFVTWHLKVNAFYRNYIWWNQHKVFSAKLKKKVWIVFRGNVSSIERIDRKKMQITQAEKQSNQRKKRGNCTGINNYKACKQTHANTFLSLYSGLRCLTVDALTIVIVIL